MKCVHLSASVIRVRVDHGRGAFVPVFNKTGVCLSRRNAESYRKELADFVLLFRSNKTHVAAVFTYMLEGILCRFP